MTMIFEQNGFQFTKFLNHPESPVFNVRIFKKEDCTLNIRLQNENLVYKATFPHKYELHIAKKISDEEKIKLLCEIFTSQKINKSYAYETTTSNCGGRNSKDFGAEFYIDCFSIEILCVSFFFELFDSTKEKDQEIAELKQKIVKLETELLNLKKTEKNVEKNEEFRNVVSNLDPTIPENLDRVYNISDELDDFTESQYKRQMTPYEVRTYIQEYISKNNLFATPYKFFQLDANLRKLMGTNLVCLIRKEDILLNLKHHFLSFVE